MVDNTIALQVKPPEASDLSTTMLRAYQIKNAQSQNELAGINLEAAKQRQGALTDYSMRKRSGDPRAADALAAQPDLQSQVFQNMTAERETRIRAIGDAAKAVYPLRGQPGFKEAWQREMDQLHKDGNIPEATYRQWRDNPSELALDQALSMSVGLDAYLKTQGQAMAAKVVSAIQPMLAPDQSAGPSAAAPKIDGYAANVIIGESGGRNIANASGPGGTPASSAFGVMQFTKGTWDSMMKNHPDLGLTVADRFVPQKQIVAEQRLRRDNAELLAGADIVPTDRNLYMAHFLGGQGAKDFLTGMATNPDQPAIDLVSPAAAAANRSVFYSPGGQPLTARQVYEKQTSRFGDGMAGISGAVPARTGPMTEATTINDRIAAAVPALTALAMQPGLPEDTRKTLLELTKAGITAGQPTTDEKDWQSYARAEVQAGRVPLTRLDWKVAEKRAGATSVVVGGAKKISEGLGERYLKAEDASVSAAAELRQYEQMDKLLDDPNVYTGTAAGPISELKKAGVTLLGLNLKGVPNAEVAKKIVDEIALSYKKKTSDASTSDFERKLYERMAPNIGDSAAGRKLLIAMRTADLRNVQQQAEIWRAHVQKDGSVDPTVYQALGELEAGRRKELGGFMESMNAFASSTAQPSPTAGAGNAIQQLREKYKGLEP